MDKSISVIHVENNNSTNRVLRGKFIAFLCNTKNAMVRETKRKQGFPALLLKLKGSKSIKERKDIG